MCHILLALPFIALPLFWVLPAAVAGPIYGGVIVLTGAIYGIAVRAMKQPLQNGVEGMIGEFGTVVDCRGGDIFVRARNELWQATSGMTLREGDHVEVCGFDRMTLRVRKAEGRFPYGCAPSASSEK